jgi:hypothetical protein
MNTFAAGVKQCRMYSNAGCHGELARSLQAVAWLAIEQL